MRPVRCQVLVPAPPVARLLGLVTHAAPPSPQPAAVPCCALSENLLQDKQTVLSAQGGVASTGEGVAAFVKFLR
jgi:hypothetical protein